ncbi:MAG: hypothetical protein HQ509_12465 [Candidatus Marinimicrobia bacterium]|nr:hypothetical protein [Candidatus Neomarinimicrobiota bacterium]
MITVSTKGTLPEFLSLERITDRLKLEQDAQIIFDRNPNIVANVESNDDTVVVKLFGWRNLAHYYLYPFIQSRAQVSWAIAHALLKASARTPKPLYVYTKRKFGFIESNVFITDCISPNITLRSYLKTDFHLNDGNQIVGDLAINISRMHEHGIFHRDLTTGNILIDEKNKTYLIDLNRAKIRKPTLHRRLKDLAKIYFGDSGTSHTIELRKTFFKIYMKECGIDIHWEEKYFLYRAKLSNYRHRRKRIKSFFRSK